MSPSNMLELQKLVLENVHENIFLFEKELRKSFKWLGNEDLHKLYNWAVLNFNERYQRIIDCVYSGFYYKIN
jgi:hypothetical protein